MNWIANATKNKGGLHKSLGVPLGTKISAKLMNKAMHSKDMKTRKQAMLAKTLERMHS